MKSTRENYLEYFMLPSPLNPFVAEYDAPSGYTTTWWSFEEALESVLGDPMADFDRSYWTGLSMAIARGSPGYGSADSALYGYGVSSGSKILHTSTTATEGATVYTRMEKADSITTIDNFFPDVSNTTSWVDGQNHISKMTNTGIYYAVPPLTSKGFLRHTKPFAMASKNAFFKMSGPDKAPINPCPGCKTIGRANNGWHEMTAFYRGNVEGFGAYNPYALVDGTPYFNANATDGVFWEWQTTAAFSSMITAGIWDNAAYDTMMDYLEVNENTYGSAAFTSFYIYETWYAILTTYSGNAGATNDDIFTTSYYHTKAQARALTYGTNIVSSGGYPDNTSLSNTAVSRVDLGPSTGPWAWVNPILATRPGQSEVTSIPYVLHSDNAKSLAVAEALLGASAGGGDTALEGATDGGHTTTCYLDNRWGSSASKFIIGDVMRRFQMKTDTADGDYRRIGSSTLAKGFLANKAWILQNSLTIWNGKLENKVNQQLTRNLDIDLMHPVGDSPDSTSYASSPSVPVTTTPGGSSY